MFEQSFWIIINPRQWKIYGCQHTKARPWFVD